MVKIEDQFDEMTQKFLSQACGVRCPAKEYRDGLRAAVDEINAAIQASLELDDKDGEG